VDEIWVVGSWGWEETSGDDNNSSAPTRTLECLGIFVFLFLVFLVFLVFFFFFLSFFFFFALLLLDLLLLDFDDLDKTEDAGVSDGDCVGDFVVTDVIDASDGDFVGEFVGIDVIGASDGNNEGWAEGYLETDGACVAVGANVPL